MPGGTDFDGSSAERWEWSADEIRRVGHQVAELIAQHLTELPGGPVFRPFPNEQAQSMLAEPLPERGIPADEILQRFAAEVMPYPFGNGHPRFAGWINGPPVVISVLAEALAAAMNPSVAGGNHAATYVERQVIEWLKQMLGYPADAMGLLVSGGSAATIIGLACARHKATDGQVRSSGVQCGGRRLAIYTTDQGHSAIAKAAELLGVGTESLRAVPTDDQWRLDPAALEKAIIEDVAAGWRPMAVAASAGTVNTGAIDPLDAIRQVCDRHSVWLHVDGAYGAPAVVDPRYRPQLEPIRAADSLAADAHKWLSIPYDAGVVLVHDAELMRDTFSLVPSYLRENADPHGVTWLPWFSEYGLEQTRSFRALKIWMALLYHGRTGYAESICRDNRLADHFAERVDAHPELELIAHNLSIVCLRARPAGLPNDQLNAHNQALLRAVQVGGEAFVTSTELNGRFVLRAAFVNPRMTTHDTERIVDEIVRQSARERARG